MDTAMFREMWATLLKREFGNKLKNQKIILIQKVAQLLFKVNIKVVLDFFNRPTANFKMKYLPPQENSESIEASIVCEYLSVSVGYNACNVFLYKTYGSHAVCYLGGDLVEGEDWEDAAVADAGCALDCVRV